MCFTFTQKLNFFVCFLLLLLLNSTVHYHARIEEKENKREVHDSLLSSGHVSISLIMLKQFAQILFLDMVMRNDVRRTRVEFRPSSC